MKTLITKSDGTPTKSKIYAVKFLKEKGISEDCLIQENGQFFYEYPDNDQSPMPFDIDNQKAVELKPVTWDTQVFTGSEKTKLYIPNTDITATITAKHPAGQIKQVNSFEIAIGQENFIMSLDLISKLFKVRG